MKGKYYLGIDVGTTAIKAMLLGPELQVIAQVSKEHTQYFPQPGWVEQDPQEILSNCIELTCRLLVMVGSTASEIRALGIDHQGETCLIWDKQTGEPIYPAIVWQDRRMQQATESYNALHGEEIRTLTGLRPDSYYSAWKLRWILDNVPQAQARAEAGELLAGELNTWLIWKLTGGKSFVNDDGSAGCTMLADPRRQGWEEGLCRQMNLPLHLLPQCTDSDAFLGVTAGDSFLGAEVPIYASLTDAAAGMVGVGNSRAGQMLTTYGTGNFMHLLTGENYVTPQNGLTASCCYSWRGGRTYQLNGIGYTAGAAIQWLRDGLGIIADGRETEALARSVKDTGGVYFVPALNGLATPYWDQSARGALMGLTAGVERAHIVRAVLESSALQVANAYEMMRRAGASAPQSMDAVGGMTKNGFLMQLQADLLGIPVALPQQTEPAFGVACMAAMGENRQLTPDHIRQINPRTAIYEPQMAAQERQERLAAWCDAVERCLHWKNR